MLEVLKPGTSKSPTATTKWLFSMPTCCPHGEAIVLLFGVPLVFLEVVGPRKLAGVGCHGRDIQRSIF